MREEAQGQEVRPESTIVAGLAGIETQIDRLANIYARAARLLAPILTPEGPEAATPDFATVGPVESPLAVTVHAHGAQLLRIGHQLDGLLNRVEV
jgi:hypothetical protein